MFVVLLIIKISFSRNKKNKTMILGKGLASLELQHLIQWQFFKDILG